MRLKSQHLTPLLLFTDNTRKNNDLTQVCTYLTLVSEINDNLVYMTPFCVWFFSQKAINFYEYMYIYMYIKNNLKNKKIIQACTQTSHLFIALISTNSRHKTPNTFSKKKKDYYYILRCTEWSNWSIQSPSCPHRSDYYSRDSTFSGLEDLGTHQIAPRLSYCRTNPTSSNWSTHWTLEPRSWTVGSSSGPVVPTVSNPRMPLPRYRLSDCDADSRSWDRSILWNLSSTPRPTDCTPKTSRPTCANPSIHLAGLTSTYCSPDEGGSTLASDQTYHSPRWKSYCRSTRGTAATRTIPRRNFYLSTGCRCGPDRATSSLIDPRTCLSVCRWSCWRWETTNSIVSIRRTNWARVVQRCCPGPIVPIYPNLWTIPSSPRISCYPNRGWAWSWTDFWTPPPWWRADSCRGSPASPRIPVEWRPPACLSSRTPCNRLSACTGIVPGIGRPSTGAEERTGGWKEFRSSRSAEFFHAPTRLFLAERLSSTSLYNPLLDCTELHRDLARGGRHDPCHYYLARKCGSQPRRLIISNTFVRICRESILRIGMNLIETKE